MNQKRDDRPRDSARQFVLLGASNLTFGISAAAGVIERQADSPERIFVAMGHGRSYGSASTVLGRTLPGILDCRLWDDWSSRAGMRTRAVVTDIGNDILYGFAVPQIASWIEEVLVRLRSAEAKVAMTLLPMSSISRLSPRRFLFFRKLFFPRSSLGLEEARSRAEELNERLRGLAERHDVRAVEQAPHWYGVDPIHIRWRHWPAAWSEIIGPFDSAKNSKELGKTRSLRRWIYLASRAPHERAFFGNARHRAQPSARLSRAASISFY